MFLNYLNKLYISIDKLNNNQLILLTAIVSPICLIISKNEIINGTLTKYIFGKLIK